MQKKAVQRTLGAVNRFWVMSYLSAAARRLNSWDGMKIEGCRRYKVQLH